VAVGRFSLWQLAGFHCDSWQVFIVTVGRFSLWQLAGFHCGSWQFFIVAIGRILQDIAKNLISQTIFPIEIRFSNKI
jgi:hypothetical protein